MQLNNPKSKSRLLPFSFPMKKNYVYFVAPLAGLVVFSAVYWKYSSGYEQKQEDIKKKIQADLQAKLDKEARDREIAAKEAFASQEKRKADKVAKDKKDAEEDELRQKAAQNREKARREAEKLAAQAKRLKKDIEDEKKEVVAIEAEKKQHQDEVAFLRTYVKKSEDNLRNLTIDLDKMTEADKKWEEAAREAARAAKAAAAAAKK